MRRILRGHDFNLADLKADPAGVSVYLCLPASRIGLCNRWLRIFVNQLLDAMEREKTLAGPPLCYHRRQPGGAIWGISVYGVWGRWPPEESGASGATPLGEAESLS